MKKNMAKLLSVMLVLVMLLALTGCSGDQEKLVGTWEAELDMASVFNESMGDAEEAEFLAVDSFSFKMVLTFTEEDTYTMSADEDSVVAAMEGLKEDLKAGMEEYLVHVMAQEGLVMDIDEIMEMMGLSMDELIDSVVTQELIDEMVSVMVTEGKYRAEDGKLYLSDSVDTVVDMTTYETYTLEGDTLTLVSTTETDEYSEYLYPMTFTKVA